MAALFGTCGQTIGSLDIFGAVHLRNNSFIHLQQPRVSRISGGELRLFEASIFETRNEDGDLFISNGALVGVRDTALFNNRGRTIVRNFSGVHNTQLNISGAGGFFNAEQLRIFNATMNVTGQGVFSNFGSSKVFRHGENGQPGSAGGIVNLGDLARFDVIDAQYVKSGGTLNIDGSSTFVNNSGGRFSQSGGDTNITGNGFYDNDGRIDLFGGSIDLSGLGVPATSSSYTQHGGTLNVQTGALFLNEAGADRFLLNGGTFRVLAGGRATNNSVPIPNSPFGGFVNNDGSVIVDAAGILDGTGDYVQFAGATTINGLMVQTGVTVRGGSVGGTGRIRRNVTNIAGSIGPGNSPGTLTIEGDFTQGPGGALAIEIDSLVAFDLFAIEGAAALGGILNLTVDAGYATTAQEGDTLTIIRWESFSGAFSTVTGLSFGDGFVFTLDYGAAGLTLLVNAEQVAEVSEPGAIALFCIALAGLGFARRRCVLSAHLADGLEQSPIEQCIHRDDLGLAGIALTQKLGMRFGRLSRRLARILPQDASSCPEQLSLWDFVSAQSGGNGDETTRIIRRRAQYLRAGFPVD